MKIVDEIILLDAGNFSQSEEYLTIKTHIYEAIKRVVWPAENDKFAINPIKHKNGVTPIKSNFISYLQTQGWEKEQPLDLEVTQKRPGNIDAIYSVLGSFYAVEWETGNISSSHRALGKLAIGLMNRKILGGSLVVPSRLLYQWITDRVGNLPELEPYFPVWKSLVIENGILTVIVVEHDVEDPTVPLISKGTDGRALR